MFLLLFHLLQDGILLDLNEIPSLLFSESKPKLFDPLPLLSSTSTPNLTINLLCLTATIRTATPRRSAFMLSRRIRRRRRRMVMLLLLLLLLRIRMRWNWRFRSSPSRPRRLLLLLLLRLLLSLIISHWLFPNRNL